MNCETFIKSINEFRTRPILFNRLLDQHKKQNENCSCNIEFIDSDDLVKL